MIDPKLVFGVLVALGLVWTGVWGWILVGSQQKAPDTEVGPKAAALRRRLFYLFLPLAVVIFVASMIWLPYPAARAGIVGQPQLSVNVTAQQWSWTLGQTEVPSRVPVEFVVTARDVNHSLSLYNPQGQLVAQVQAMPGYTNRLIHVFDQPGTYTIRCLEFCGIAHHDMVARLTVK
ncbi:MAG: cytochrome c oxidase subunit II [Chloroflexi bacterium]|nr:cytochrome c oxidase subunit II [Chloroflexota bacterium]